MDKLAVVVYVCVFDGVCVYKLIERLKQMCPTFPQFNGLYSIIREMETVMVCVFCCDIYVIQKDSDKMLKLQLELYARYTHTHTHSPDSSDYIKRYSIV